jgi:hypothetical protein
MFKGSHYIINDYFLRVGFLKITLKTLINSNLQYRTVVVNCFSNNLDTPNKTRPCSGYCRFFPSSFTFAITKSVTAERYIDRFFKYIVKNNALHYVLSTSVTKNVQFMKVIPHSLNYLSCKRRRNRCTVREKL